MKIIHSRRRSSPHRGRRFFSNTTGIVQRIGRILQFCLRGEVEHKLDQVRRIDLDGYMMMMRTTWCRLLFTFSFFCSTAFIPFTSSEEFCPVSTPSSCSTSSSTMANNEQTFIMIKPDGVQRGLVGEIVKRFEQKGFKLVAMKFMWADEEHLKKHYADLSSRPFFGGLVKYMASGPVVPMVWEGLNVVKMGRQMLGETDPAKSLPGSIRGDYSIQVGRNIIHGSDSVESAKHEIALWFKPQELVKWKSIEDPWLYE